MTGKNIKKKIMMLFLAVVMCFMMFPTEIHANDEDWDSVSDTFTIENIKNFIPDEGFATAVYDDISNAIKSDEYHIDKENIADPDGYNDDWPEPLTIQEINDEGKTGNDLVRAILENYVGPINANNKGVRDIEGFIYLKNATSVNLQRNYIEDLSKFTNVTVAGVYSFGYNPIHIWPETLASTIRAAGLSFTSLYTVNSAPLAYRFGETVTPTLTFNVYYPDKDTVNTAWYTKEWSNATVAYGDVNPQAPQVNGKDSIQLPSFNLEGEASLDIGLTGKKHIEDYDKWYENSENAIPYHSGMNINGSGGNVGDGNSPAYCFGVKAQRYGTLNIDTTNLKITGGFTFTKTSETTGKPVADAQYTLYKDQECKKAVGGPYTTNEEGKIAENGFEPGKYYLKETKAPGGYSINSSPVLIEIASGELDTSVKGGVSSFDHDSLNPNVEAKWGVNNSTYGAWNKTTTVTKETADTYDADALITNKGNVGYNALTELKVGAGDSYDIENLKIVVSMGGEKYGEYTSEAEALAAINNITTKRLLTGDITVEYSGKYKEKVDNYSGVGEQKEALLPVYVQLDAEKNFKNSKNNQEFSFTLTGKDEADVEINKTASCDAKDGSNGYVVFDAMKYTKAGTYTYKIKEDVPEGTDLDTGYNANDKITYDVKERTVTITVTEETDGLKATVSGLDNDKVLKATDTTDADTGEILKSSNVTTDNQDKQILSRGSAGVKVTTFTNTLKTDSQDPDKPDEPGKPGNPVTPTDPSNNNNDSTTIVTTNSKTKTGDDKNILLYVNLIMLVTICIASIVCTKKKHV